MGIMGLEMENRTTLTTLVFTYGTLKRDFSNHGCLQDLMATGDASYLGVYRTLDKLPLVCGPYRVPFLLNFPGLASHRVSGELYAVSERALAHMDELEGTSRGHYERLPIKVQATTSEQEETDDEDNDSRVAEAEAYYAHRSYAQEMWTRNGYKGFSCYTKKEAQGYVYRKDRPPHLTFLDHIRLFLSSNDGHGYVDDHIDHPPLVNSKVEQHPTTTCSSLLGEQKLVAESGSVA